MQIFFFLGHSALDFIDYPPRRIYRLPLNTLHSGILGLDTRLHQTRMSENDDGRGSDKPEKGRDGRGNVEEGKACV